MKTWRSVSVIVLVSFSLYSFSSNGLYGKQPHAVAKERLQQDLVLNNQDKEFQLAKIKDFLELQPVKKTLRYLGVDQNEMQAKISVLSSEELRVLEEKVDLITEQYEGGLDALVQIVLVLLVLVVVAALVIAVKEAESQ